MLNSGLMQARDFRKMSDDFKENPIVLAAIRKKAQEYAEGLAEDQRTERAAAISVIESAKTESETLMEGFNNLNDCANMLAGRRSYGWPSRQAQYEIASLDAWEEITKDIVVRE